MNKEIVIICHNYYPEDTSTGLYTTLMAEYLAQRSWKVTMVTGFPHYPKWEINSEYLEKEIFFQEEIKGVKVLRYKHFVPRQPSFRNRIRQLADFTYGSYFNLKRVERADIILSIIPFTSSAWLGKKFTRKFRARHWIHIQDFEFDAARESGMITQNRGGEKIFALLEKIERKILDSADLVSTISQGMMTKLKKRTQSETFFFPNWLDPDFINCAKASIHPYLASDSFKVLYSGNIGEKQDWDVFMRVVSEFVDDGGIEFVVVGDGAYRNQLKTRFENFNHVSLYDPVPLKDLNDLLCSADLHVLFQKDNVIDTVMPSKLLGMMASEVPCLISGPFNSELSEIFRTHQCGLYRPSSDLPSIVEDIRKLRRSDAESRKMGKNARKFVIESFAKEIVLEKFHTKLNSIHEG